MITPNKIFIREEEITDEDIWLEYKRTYLLLQKALLKFGLKSEMIKLGENYKEAKKTLLQ